MPWKSKINLRKFFGRKYIKIVESTKQGKWEKAHHDKHVEAIDTQVLFKDRTLLKQSEEFNKSSSPQKQVELEKQSKTTILGLW